MDTSNLSIALFFSLAFFQVLLHKANAASSISFSFDGFNPYDPDLILQDDATISRNGDLQLTHIDRYGNPTSNSLGRALYPSPIQIWDRETNMAASWATYFTFNIYAPDESNTADGFALFFGPVFSKPQSNGGFLGIFNSEEYDESIQTLAVELDTYSNKRWDPEGQHIGIDVNSIKSIQTAPWSLINGETGEILVTYDAPTSILEVSWILSSGETSPILSQELDLKSFLPEWVRVGFSATTGTKEGSVETHSVFSWSFSSSLADGSSVKTLDLASLKLPKHESI